MISRSDATVIKMLFSYVQFVKSEFHSVVDPFTMQALPTELLCNPIAYLTQSEARVYEQGGDREDMQLLEQAIARDLPITEQGGHSRLAITDGASHLWGSRLQDSYALVLGIPAIGKSTLLKKVAQLCTTSATEPDSPIPLLVELHKLPLSAFISKMDFIEACFAQVEEYEAFLREKFYTGQLVLLLDGLESTHKYKTSVIEWVKSLRNIVPIPLVILTSRFNGYCEVPDARVVRMELFPLKLQISSAQLLLSEMQSERFVGLATSCGSVFTEFAYTPMLLSLLFDMFRWGQVNEDQVITKAKLNLMAVEHLVRGMSSKEAEMLQELAYELLSRGYREFCSADLKRLDLYEVWQQSQAKLEFVCLFTKAENLTEPDMSFQTLELQSANDYSQISVDIEDPIHEIRDTKTLNFRLDESRSTSVKEATPQWLDSSRYSIANYQHAKSYFEATRSAHTYGGEVFRFTHLSVLETLAALRLNYLVSDSLCRSSRSFLTETYVYQKAFANCLSISIIFSRSFRNCLMTFSAACDEFVFDYFIKYLLNFKTLEHTQLAEAFLKENQGTAKLVSKVKQIRAKLLIEQFVSGFCHPSASVRRVVLAEVQQVVRGDPNFVSMTHQEVLRHLEADEWPELVSLKDFVQESWRTVRLLLTKLYLLNSQMLKSSNKGEPYSAINQTSYITLLIKALEQPPDQLPGISPVSSANTISSQCSSPIKGELSFTGRHDSAFDGESSIRISFERLCISPIESSAIEALGSCVPKAIKSLQETLWRCEGVDLFLVIKLLLLLNCPVSHIHTALANRLIIIPESHDIEEVLQAIKELGNANQHSIEVPLKAMACPRTAAIATQILEGLSPYKLKRFAMNCISKDDITEDKLCLALRAIGFAEQGDVDEENLHILVQFCDHYDRQCRAEALTSLHKTLSCWRNKDLDMRIRRELAAVPHVLKDRLKLKRYDLNLQVPSLKCLAWLWIVFDREQFDLQKSQMLHILVKEHINTSFIVGSLDSLLALMKRFLGGCPELRQVLWECLTDMQIGRLLVTDELVSIVDEFIRAGLADSLETVRAKVLQMLLQAPDAVCYEKHREQLRMCILSDHTSVVQLVTRLFCRLDKLSDLISVLPYVNSSGLNNCLSDPAALVRNYRVVLETLVSLDLRPLQGLEMRTLSHQYKAFVNYLTENLPLPAHKFHRDIRQSELLDVTYEISKEETLPEFCESYIEAEARQNSSNDSANTELEDVYVPPSSALVLQLLKAGVKAEVLKYWALWHLGRLGIEPALYLELAVVWSECWRLESFYEPKVERALIEIAKISPSHAVKAAEALKFLSDDVAFELLGAVAKGKLECHGKSIAGCAVLQSADLLFLLCRYLQFKHKNGSLGKKVQATALSVLTELRLSREEQLETSVEYLCFNECPYILQMVWAYLLSQVSKNSKYRLTERIANALETSKTWEGKFLNRWCRSLGLIFCGSNDDLSTQASRATPV